MSRIAIFIDGGYLASVLREDFAGAQFDFNRLSNQIAGGIELLRTYYYHCLPYQSDPPTEEESRRLAAAQRFLHALDRLPRYCVRLGKLASRGRNAEGRPILVQKRVDILLGTDLVLPQLKATNTHAALVAGDSDFLPAIEAARNEGGRGSPVSRAETSSGVCGTVATSAR